MPDDVASVLLTNRPHWRSATWASRPSTESAATSTPSSPRSRTVWPRPRPRKRKQSSSSPAGGVVCNRIESGRAHRCLIVKHTLHMFFLLPDRDGSHTDRPYEPMPNAPMHISTIPEQNRNAQNDCMDSHAINLLAETECRTRGGWEEASRTSALLPRPASEGQGPCRVPKARVRAMVVSVSPLSLRTHDSSQRPMLMVETAQGRPVYGGGGAVGEHGSRWAGLRRSPARYQASG